MNDTAPRARKAFKLKTRLSFEELDSLVAEYARRPYQITLGGIDEVGSIPAKIMIIRFDDPEDYERLRILFARRRTPMAAPSPTTSAQATIRRGALHSAFGHLKQRAS
jgi:hypothetical protein